MASDELGLFKKKLQLMGKGGLIHDLEDLKESGKTNFCSKT